MNFATNLEHCGDIIEKPDAITARKPVAATSFRKRASRDKIIPQQGHQKPAIGTKHFYDQRPETGKAID